MSRLHGLAADGAVRFVAVEVSAAADRVREVHNLAPTAARVAAEATVATALLSAFIKGEERVSLHVQVDHPRASYASDLDASGRFRARFSPPNLSRLPLAMQGVLAVIKSDTTGELYRGATAIEGESIENALRRHLIQSNQVDGRLGIAVEEDDEGVGFAAGYWLERLPDEPGKPSLSAAEFARLFDQSGGQPVRQVLEAIRDGELYGGKVETLDHQPVDFDCWCSRDKVGSMLASLGRDTLTTLIDEDGGAEVNCHFCNTSFAFDVPQLRALSPD